VKTGWFLALFAFGQFTHYLCRYCSGISGISNIENIAPTPLPGQANYGQHGGALHVESS
jgi:hypothetical protein